MQRLFSLILALPITLAIVTPALANEPISLEISVENEDSINFTDTIRNQIEAKEFEVAINAAEKEIINYLDDSKIEYDSRLMLQCEIFNTTTSKLLQTHNALNDIVISRGSDPKLLDINTEIDSVDLHTYRADGLIISSPTGTTGYSLAAGGPIISPNSDVMLLQPLAAHMNFSKSLVVGKSSIINISLVSKQSASLIVDGIKEIDFSTDHLLRIRKSSNSTVFIRKDSKNNFYATLTNRLLS